MESRITSGPSGLAPFLSTRQVEAILTGRQALTTPVSSFLLRPAFIRARMLYTEAAYSMARTI